MSIDRVNLSRRSLGLGGLGVAAAALVGQLPSRAFAATNEEQALLDQARATIATARHDPQFGDSGELLRHARAIMVVPELVKGGFFFGGEGGNAVLLSRNARGGWGEPVFYVLGSASFGLQIGLEVAQMILFIQSERALQAFMQDEFKIGAEAGLTVLVVGTNAQAATTANANVDILAWAKAKGAYGGLTLEGTIIKPRTEWNAAYYGRPVTAAQIVNGNVGHASGADSLRNSLS